MDDKGVGTAGDAADSGAGDPADGTAALTVTFVGSGDAFGSGGRFQACVHLRARDDADTPAASGAGTAPDTGTAAGAGTEAAAPALLVDCGATSLTALKSQGFDPDEVGAVLVSHLHGDHFGGLPFLILDGQFSGRTAPLTVAGPPGTAERLTAAQELMFPGSSRPTSGTSRSRTICASPTWRNTAAG